MIRFSELEAYRAGYEALPKEPLRVTLELATARAGDDTLHLDDILAAAVAKEATRGLGYPIMAGVLAIPLPLEALWRSPEGLPLWAANPLLPQGSQARYVQHYHKKAPLHRGGLVGTKTGRWNPNVAAGPTKEYRIPTRFENAECYQADLLGDRAEVARLLSLISSVGKRKGAGGGRVMGWLVEEARGFKLARPVPLASGFTNGVSLGVMGWSPAYWNPDCQTECGYAGT